MRRTGPSFYPVWLLKVNDLAQLQFTTAFKMLSAVLWLGKKKLVCHHCDTLSAGTLSGTT